MSRRSLLPGLLLGASLAGAASALAASNEQPPAASEPGQQPAARSVALVGVMQVDETKLARIAVRVKSRITTVTLDVPAVPQAGPPDKKDAKLKELLKERLATLRELAEQTTKDYSTGKASFDRVHQTTMAVLRAELGLCESDKERITVLEKIVAQAKEYEKIAVQRYKTGAAPASDALMAKAGRLEVEIALERAKSKVPAQPK